MAWCSVIVLLSSLSFTGDDDLLSTLTGDDARLSNLSLRGEDDIVRGVYGRIVDPELISYYGKMENREEREGN